MANELSTIGVKLKYAVETTAGTKPSSFTEIAGIVSIPGLNEAPEQLDCTPLDEENYRRFIPGLKSVGGALGIKVNLTSTLETAWSALVTASETAESSSKATWFEIYIPGFKGFFFTGKPSTLGIDSVEVNNVLQTTAYVTVNTVSGFDTLV